MKQSNWVKEFYAIKIFFFGISEGWNVGNCSDKLDRALLNFFYTKLEKDIKGVAMIINMGVCGLIREHVFC